VSKRWVYALVAVLAVSLLLTVLISVDEFGNGSESFGLPQLLAVISIAWVLVVLVVTSLVVRSLLAARRQLHHTTEAMTATAESTREWLWEMDMDRRFTYSNAAVTTLLGYEPDEVVGRDAREFLIDDEVPRLRRFFEADPRGLGGWPMAEARWRRRDGAVVVLEGSAAAIHDTRNQVVGYRGSRRKVTDAILSDRGIAAARERVQAVLTTQALDIAFQPIVHLMTRELVGSEALARFRDGRSPDAWFTDARVAGLSIPLELFAIARAFGAAAYLPPSSYVSVNASPALILDPGFARLIEQATIARDRIVVEVTEQVAVDDYDVLNAALNGLRSTGVRVAVDDTGAGYASLRHVMQLRPDIVKIDRSLIADIATDAARRSLITSLVLLSLDLGASLTAEGIETLDELRTLALLGLDCGQGYLLGRPSLDKSEWGLWEGRDWRVGDPEHEQPPTADRF
jgi:PAS domain S-box-containing protein